MSGPNLPSSYDLRALLDDPETARRWLAGLGVRDPARGFRDLRDLSRRGISPGLLVHLLGQLAALLPGCPDPGMALTNLDRFVAAGPSAEATATLLALDPRTADVLVQLLSTSQ